VPEVKMYGFIGLKEEVDFEELESSLRELEQNNDELVIKINSAGGLVMQGFAIYDLIRNLDMNVTTVIEGMAASMAGPIALSGDTIKMTENARYMMHKVNGMEIGEAQKLRDTADRMDEAEQDIINILVQRTGQTQKKVKEWFQPNKEKWIKANEAKKLNLVDEVIEPVKQREVSNQIENKTPEEAWPFFKNFTDFSNQSDNTMDKKELAKQLGLSEDATDEQIQNAIKALKDAQSQGQGGGQNQGGGQAPPPSTPEPSNEAQQELVNQIMFLGEAKGIVNEQNKAHYQELAKTNANAVLNLFKESGQGSGKGQDGGQEQGQGQGGGQGQGQKQESLADALNKLANQSAGTDERSDWTYDTYKEKAPEALENMMKEEPEKFKNLFKDKFGYDYPGALGEQLK